MLIPFRRDVIVSATVVLGVYPSETTDIIGVDISMESARTRRKTH